MVFTLITPLPAVNAYPRVIPPTPDRNGIDPTDDIDEEMSSSHPSSPSNRLRLHASPAASKAARDSIINSSAKGWSPLQINKRAGDASSPNPSISSNPTSPQPGGSTTPSDGPRRTSNSFKHVNRNSLVSNSPFKNTSTLQGAQAAGLDVSGNGKREVIHERRAVGASRQMGQSLPTATGAASTPKAAIGLGIGIAAKPRGRTPSGTGSSGAAVSGQRKVSSDRNRIVVASQERKASGSGSGAGGGGERRVSKENESPDVRANRKPRQSGALSGLKEQSYVSRSPFLSGPSAVIGGSDTGTPSPKTISSNRSETTSAPFPQPRRVSGNRKVSPASRSIRTSPSPTPSPPRLFSHSTSLGMGPSPLRGATLGAPRLGDDDRTRSQGRTPSPSPGPVKSAMTPSRRLLGPRTHAALAESPSKAPKTVTFQSVPDVKEFEIASVENSPNTSFDLHMGIASIGTRSGLGMDEDEWVDENEHEHEHEHGHEHDDELEDVNMGAEGDSLEEIMSGAQLDRAMGGMTITDEEDDDDGGQEIMRSPDLDTVDEHDHDNDNNNNNRHEDESTTANFLMEQGIFTPEPASAALVPTVEVPDMGPTRTKLPTPTGSTASGSSDSERSGVNTNTTVSNNSSAQSSSAPYLSTPSFGGSVTMEPMFPEVDDAGIPYGRMHHAERNAQRHELPPVATVSPLEHPDLPVNTDHQMLLNANAAQPALPIPITSSSPAGPILTNKEGSSTPHAHQVGAMHDPFITIQTATSVLSPKGSSASANGGEGRKEDGIPLGRTSHAERINAARQLATQSIGLGLPRSPARVAQDERMEKVVDMPSPAQARGKKVEVIEDVQSESGSEVDSGSDGEDDEGFFASPRRVSKPKQEVHQQSALHENGKAGKLQPPMPLDVPMPVEARRDEQQKQEKRSSKFTIAGFSLPSINATSPFFPQTPAFSDNPQPRIPSNDPSEPSTLPSDDDRPLTPPPPPAHIQQANKKDESPHRIPSLEFEEIRFTMSEEQELRKAEIRPNPHSPTKIKFDPTSTSTSQSPSKPNVSAGAGGSASASAGASPVKDGNQVKVRQRISREMIRETIDRKYAEGSISRRPASMLGPTANISAASPVKAAAPTTSTSITPSNSSSSNGTATSTTSSEKRLSAMKGYSNSIQPPTLSVSSPSPPTTRARPMSVTMDAYTQAHSPSTVSPTNTGAGTGTNRNKALPTPPLATPMMKSATEIPSATSTSAARGERKVSRPRSNTQYDGQPLAQLGGGGQQQTKEPRSALDKIISGVLPGRSHTKAAEKDRDSMKPVGILQNHTPSNSAVPTTKTATTSGTAAGSTHTQTQKHPAPVPLPVRGSSMLPPPRQPHVQVDDQVRPKSAIELGQERSETQARSPTRPTPPTGPKPKPTRNASPAKRPAPPPLVAPGHANGREQKQRNVSGISLVSTGSRRSRRSMSMSDAVDAAPIVKPNARKQPRLTLGLGEDKSSMADQFKEELESISGDRGYKIRERHVNPTSYSGTVSHPKAGDIERGKAWRQLRRPSDINEHAAEIRARREKSNDKNVAGTIFVKVLGIESLGVPLPVEPTNFCVTLDNGIDYIKTSYMRLLDGARVNQEFALVEQPNFSFSLSLEVRRDPHIMRLQEQERAHALRQQQPAPPMPVARPTSSSRQASLALPLGSSRGPGGGLKSLFTSPRRGKSTAPSTVSASPSTSPSIVSSAGGFAKPALPLPPLRESIASYLPTAGSSTFAKTHIAFKPIARQCEAKVLEIRYPMFAMFKGEPERRGQEQQGGGAGNIPPNAARKQVAKITLQVFRLPPLPGLDEEELPKCIDECLRGMRHHAWHEVEYHEGMLTQQGGDCKYPRRRMFKLVGGKMIASNEVTGKEWATIELRHAISVIDLNPGALGDSSSSAAGTAMTKAKSYDMDDEEGYTIARPFSFKVGFEDGESITFSADRAEDKESWMDALEGLIGKIPSNPLWADLLATKLREQKERHAMRSASRSTMTSSTGHSHSSGNSGYRDRDGRKSSGVHRTRSRDVRAEDDQRDILAGRKGEGVV